MSNKNDERRVIGGDRRAHPDIPHVDIAAPHGGEMVRIHQEELERLRQRDKVLSALENGGVDNWEGFDSTMELLNE